MGAAGYCVYGSSTQLIKCIDKVVKWLQEFVQRHLMNLNDRTKSFFLYQLSIL